MKFRRVSAYSIIFVIVVNLGGAGISNGFAKIRFKLAQKSSFERTGLEDSVDPPFKINGISVDGQGNLYFSFRNIIACLQPDSETVRIVSKLEVGQFENTTIRVTTEWIDDIALDVKGDIFYIGRLNRIRRLNLQDNSIADIAGSGRFESSPDGTSVLLAAFRRARSVAVGGDGNPIIYISDDLDHRVRIVDFRTATISTIAGNGIAGYSGDGELATNASLRFPYGVAVNTRGDLFIADYENHRIRKVDGKTRIISTVAGNGQEDAESDGLPAINTSVKLPTHVAADINGNLYIAETSRDCIRKVEAGTGIITTIAGNKQKGFSGDGGKAFKAQLNNPSQIAVDKSGNLFLVDYMNDRIRKIDGRTGLINTVVDQYIIAQSLAQYRRF